MECILVLTHADETGSTLTRASLEGVTAGKELAASLSATLTIGIIAENAAATASSISSAASRILAVSGEAFAQPRYATDAAACEALCRAAQASLVLAPAGSRFARVVAGVAHRLGGVIDTHITSIASADSIQASRWFYRQRVEAVLTRDKRPWFLRLESGSFAPFSAEPAPPSIEQIAVEVPITRTTVAGFRTPAQDAQTIRP